MSVTNVKDFQKEEVYAIKNIYQNEYELLQGCFKKKYKPPKLSIFVNVKPEKLSEKNLEKSLKLIINCSDKYPAEAPELSLLNLQNINTKEESALLKRLNEKANDNLNSPMMHGLIEECRDFLREVVDSNARAKEAPAPKPAINMDMMHERQELVKKCENEKIKVEPCQHVYNEDGKPVLFTSNGKSEQVRVLMGRCNGVHKVSLLSSKSRLVTNEYAGYNLSEGKSVKIRQIAIFRQLELTSTHYLDSDLLKNLSDDLIGLSKLSHPNIIPYLGSKVTQSSNKKKKSVQICAQYLVSDNGYKALREVCANFPPQNESNNPRIPEQVIKKIIRETMDAVKYLHDRNITFIKINMSSILLDPQLHVFISEYCIGKRLLELSEYDGIDGNSTGANATNDSWKNLKKGTKKYDICHVGLLAEELFYFGISEEERLEDSCAVMPAKLISFIEYCRERPEDAFLHEYIQQSTCKNGSTNDAGVTGCGDGDKVALRFGISEGTEDQLKEWRFFDDHSRIPTEFEVIECLGSGSFGSVVKVRNKYDNQFYAIKRVRMSKLKKKAEKRTMREVQLLSSLNHENIVRYYATWSEDVPVQSANQSETTTTTTTNENSFIIKRRMSSSLGNNISNGESVVKQSISNTGLVDLSESVSNANVSFMHESDYSDDDDDSDDDDSDDDDSYDDESTDNSLSAKSDSLITFGERSQQDDHLSWGSRKSIGDRSNVPRNSKEKSDRSQKFLMIQMELCEGSSNTLQKWIETRSLHKNERLIWRFVREITAGLDHLHSKNMIHRDLKPGNIFLDAQDRIKVGDLGLAVDFVSHDKGGETITSPGGPVGTSMYICPEIMSSRPYSAKADMYSMGIIVFEMTYPPFKTGSERVRTLENLRSTEIKFPADYRCNDARFKALITTLLSHDASQRPSSADLMQFEQIPPPEAREMELRKHLVRVTNDPSSALYKILLKKMFSKMTGSMGNYEILVSGQSSFRQFILNSNHDEVDNAKLIKKKEKFHDLVNGDFQYFEIQQMVEEKLRNIFRNHGAAPLLPPMLHPNGALHATVGCPDQNNATRISLIDSEGVVVHLPRDLRENWVLFILNNGITNCRRYALGPVFKQQDYKGYHPRQTTEAVFDVVCDKDDVKPKVECICMLETILNQLFQREAKFDLQINDTRLFRAIMEYFKIPVNHLSHISAFFQQLVLQKCNKVSMESMETELRKDLGMGDSNYQFMRQILSFSGHISEFKKYLRTFSNRVADMECCKTIMAGYSQLEQLVHHVEARLHDRHHFNLSLTPSLTYNSESALFHSFNLYSGLIFRLVVKFPISEVSSNVSGSDSGPVSKGRKEISDKTHRAVAKFLNTPRILCVGGSYGGNWLGCPKCVNSFPVSGTRTRCRHLHGVGLSIDITGFTQTLYNLSLISSSYYHLPSRNGLIQVLIENIHPQDDLIAWKMANRFREHGISTIIDTDDSLSHTKKQSIPIYIQITSSSTCVSQQSECGIDISSCSGTSRIFMMQYYPSVVKLADDCARKWESIVNRCITRLHNSNAHYFSIRRQSINSSVTRSKGVGVHQSSSNLNMEHNLDPEMFPLDDSLPPSVPMSNQTSNAASHQHQSVDESAQSSSNSITFLFISSNTSKQFVYGRLPETAKHLHQMRARLSDKLVNNTEAGLILRASIRLQKEASWFSSQYISSARLLSGFSISLVLLELDSSVCRGIVEQATGLSVCLSKTVAGKMAEETCSRMSGSLDKQFKQLLTSLWNCIISYAKDKIYKLALYSISDDQIFLVDLK